MEVTYTSPECKTIALRIEQRCLISDSELPYYDNGLPGYGPGKTNPEDDEWEIG